MVSTAISIRTRTRSVSPRRRVHFCDVAEDRPVVRYGPRRWQHRAWEQYLNALLADLQNTVSPGHTSTNSSGYGSLNAPRAARQVPIDIVDMVPSNYESSFTNTGLYGKTQEVERKPFSNNLSELDNLLHDLSHSRGSNSPGNGLVTYSRHNSCSPKSLSTSSSTHSTLNRRTVDSLLDELNTGDVMYTGPRKVTITVQETKTESAVPVSTSRTESSHITNMTTNGNAVASTATRELDDLMASLSEIKVQRQQSPCQRPHQQLHHNHHHHHHQKQVLSELKSSTTTVAQEDHHAVTAGSASPSTSEPVVCNQQYARLVKSSASSTSLGAGGQLQQHHSLDYMLGSLQADMSRQGVNTSQKGCCMACDKPIVGQVITALGKTWHPEHFTCAHCTQELGTRNFFERDGKPYCEPDYHNLFSPRCAYCNGPILDKCVTAMDKTWHMEHFFCAQCGKQFGEDGFHEREGKPYCRDDYFDMFAPKCGACARAIMENYISALNAQWHPDCFVCRDCRQPFIGGSFFDHDGQPYCETHYHLKRGSLCAGCHKPISGRCITAMFRKFHPEHFVCAFCLKQLNKGTFKEQNDKPYCHNCFEKLFG